MKLKKIWKVWLALLLCAVPVCAEGNVAPSATPAGAEDFVAASALKDDGVMRVELRSLGAPGALNLTLDGVYTVEHDAGFRFARGAQILLFESDGKVWLEAGGLTMDMGSALTLTRQAAGKDAANGLRIAEAKRDNLYPGDLSVSVDEGGLRAVLAIGMEDYLCGVVAYEMSDDWPLEALKAQTVAARTYAMRAKWNAGGRDYDVVDTTADQVFFGLDANNANVAEAVRTTAGVVGTYKGGFANCFYTASNGGETALPSDVWGDEGDYGYLERRADPYDLENKNSMVASAVFTPGATDLPALKEMLQEALEAESGVEGIEFEAIRSIEPMNPVAKGSIVCKKLRFTLTATAPVERLRPSEDDAGAPGKAAGKPGSDAALYAIDFLRRLLLGSPYVAVTERETLDEEFTVDLDVYDQIKDGLGLSLNGSDCEVASVSKDIFGFTIELRRFGHGVGMSQRGAQTMAGAHGMSWIEILNFYYPGMELERIEWDAPKLEALEALSNSFGRARPEPSPAPTPAPLPELEEGEYYARVTLGDASSNMNLRQSPSTQAQVVARLFHNQRVIVRGEADADGWVRVRTAEYEGYAKLEYLKAESAD